MSIQFPKLESNAKVKGAYVIVEDHILPSSEATRRKNGQWHGYSTLGKIRMPYDVIGESRDAIRLRLRPQQEDPKEMEIYTPPYKNHKAELNEDHGKMLRRRADRTIRGGNAYNTFADLQHKASIGFIETHDPEGLQVGPMRTAIHTPVEHEHGKGTLIIVAPASDTSKGYTRSHKTLQQGTDIIAGAHPAHYWKEVHGLGTEVHGNPSGNEIERMGFESALYGRAPSLSLGITEMTKFLQGAADAHHQHIHLPGGFRGEEDTTFCDGSIHPHVARVISTMGTLYDKLMLVCGRQHRKRHQIGITAGSGGGANRLTDEDLGNLWAFTSPPNREGSRSIIAPIEVLQTEPLTSQDTVSTSGCGDRASSILAFANNYLSEQYTPASTGGNMRKILAAYMRHTDTLANEECFLAIAEVAFISIITRLESEIVLRTASTHSHHIQNAEFYRWLYGKAANAAVSLAREWHTQRLEGCSPKVALIPEFGMQIALWHQHSHSEEVADIEPFSLFRRRDHLPASEVLDYSI